MSSSSVRSTQLGVAHIVLSTHGEWLKPLVRFLMIERRRR